MNNWSHVRDVLKNIGTRSIIASLMVFLLTVAVTFAGGIHLYNFTKESIVLQGEVNAQQSAMSFDRYLLVRKNTVLLAGNAVNNMLAEDRPESDILEYITNETQSIKASIDKDYTGLYGWVRNQYLDGGGWIPDEDFVPTERPWYTETMADDSEITFVTPYVDAQTHNVMMTLAVRLKDGASILALDISLEQIQQITEEIARQTRDSYCFVLNNDGKVIAHSDPGELGKNYLRESGTLGSSVVQTLYQEGDHQFEIDFGGQQYIVYAEKLEGGWYCASLVNTAEFYRPLKIILALLLILTLLEAFVFIAVFYHLSSKNLAISIQNVQLAALGDMYMSIQDIDLRNDSIRTIHRDHDDEGSHDIRLSQHGAGSALREICDKQVDDSCKEIMSSFADIATISQRLHNTSTVAAEYLNDQNIWCRARFLAAARNAEGEAVRVMWLIESIDEEKKNRDRLKSLSETDPMTGVRSKHAYLMKEKELNQEIESDSAGEFAVAVCDVNGLKKINDTYGHKAGDDYIKEACMMVCDIFQHSPVYRVGGDEFTVIMTGRDYSIRKELLTMLHGRSLDHITAGGAVISGGMSDFRPGEDKSAHDVFQRADELMYEEKKLLKRHGAVTRDGESEAAPEGGANTPESIVKVKRRVLIADDEQVNRERLSAGLGNGYDLVFAFDGYEALEQIRAHKDDLALILLDLLMPRLSGIEVLKAMKNDEEIRDIPVIVMTDDPAAELECLHLGVMDFVSKPYPQWEIVRARVNRCIELAEDRDMVRSTERDKHTSLFNIDYFFRYVKLFDQNDWEASMDAVAVLVRNYREICEHHGASCGSKVIRSIGERLRTIAREFGGVGSRQEEDTFLMYCPHREDYQELLSRLSANLAADELSTAKPELSMGVYALVDKKLDIELRFEKAKEKAKAEAGQG
jgi:diguanylate cyclase (GGDEF)-like protein